MTLKSSPGLTGYATLSVSLLQPDMFFLLMFVENKNNYIPKDPQRISMLTGDAFIKEILNGNPRTCYELFCMDRPTLTSLCNYLRTHKFLTNSRWITVGGGSWYVPINSGT